MTIKDVLPKLRQDKGMTQQELASKLYVTRQAVSRWETGETTPSIDMAKLIASVLDEPVMRVARRSQRIRRRRNDYRPCDGERQGADRLTPEKTSQLHFHNCSSPL